MNIVDYDYKEFTKKDMFEIRLKGIRPRFGYISSNKKKHFYQFCVDMGFAEFAGSAFQKKRYAYKILVAFAYDTLIAYSPSQQDCDPGGHMIVDGILNA